MSGIRTIFFLLLLTVFGCTADRADQKAVKPITLSNPKQDSIIALIKEMRYRDPMKALIICRELNYIGSIEQDTVALAEAALLSGSIYFDLKKFSESRNAFMEAQTYIYHPAVVHTTIPVRLNNNLGNIHNKSGRNDSAMVYYFRALAWLEKAGNITDSTLLMIVYGNIGAALANSEQNNKANFYLQKSLQIARLIKDSIAIAGSYANLANFQEMSRHNIDSALYHLKEALVIYKSLQFVAEVQETYVQMGRLWGVKKDLAMVKKYLDSASGTSTVLARGNSTLMRMYGDYYMINRQYATALGYYSTAATLSAADGTEGSISNIRIYEGLAECYYRLGKARDAYLAQKKYTALLSNVLNQEKTAIVNNLEVRYRSLEQDNKIAAQQKMIDARDQKIKFRSIIYVASVLVLLMIIGFIILRWRNSKRLQKVQLQALQRQDMLNQLTLTIQGEENERARMANELHDGIGVLISVLKMNYTMLQKEVPERDRAQLAADGMEVIEEMRHELKAIVQNLIPGHFNKVTLPEALLTLIKRAQLSGKPKIEFNWYGEVKELVPEVALALFRVIEEIVNNVIKHADADTLLIQIVYHPESINISFEDDGKGFDVNEYSNGIGLYNITNRVKAMGGVVSFSSSENIGTSVVIEIPFH